MTTAHGALMTRSTPRTFAAILLTVGAFLAASVALGFAAARAVLDGGLFEVTPRDAAIVVDLAAVAPFIAVYALAGLVAAVGILLETTWSTVVATSVAVVGIVASTIPVVVLILGRDPFAAIGSDRAADGIAMLGSVAIYYLAVVAFIALGRPRPAGRTSLAAA